MKPMDDSVVFLTGAAEGLGKEIARELARAGKRLALMDVQAEKLQAIATELAPSWRVMLICAAGRPSPATIRVWSSVPAPTVPRSRTRTPGPAAVGATNSMRFPSGSVT